MTSRIIEYSSFLRIQTSLQYVCSLDELSDDVKEVVIKLVEKAGNNAAGLLDLVRDAINFHSMIFNGITLAITVSGMDMSSYPILKAALRFRDDHVLNYIDYYVASTRGICEKNVPVHPLWFLFKQLHSVIFDSGNSSNISSRIKELLKKNDSLFLSKIDEGEPLVKVQSSASILDEMQKCTTVAPDYDPSIYDEDVVVVDDLADMENQDCDYNYVHSRLKEFYNISGGRVPESEEFTSENLQSKTSPSPTSPARSQSTSPAKYLKASPTRSPKASPARSLRGSSSLRGSQSPRGSQSRSLRASPARSEKGESSPHAQQTPPSSPNSQQQYNNESSSLKNYLSSSDDFDFNEES